MNLNNPLIIATFLAVANERIIEYLVVGPISKNAPKFYAAYGWLTMYLAAITGGLLGFFSGLDLFIGTGLPDMVGRVLTAAVIGGGSQLINLIMPSTVPDEKPALVSGVSLNRERLE